MAANRTGSGYLGLQLIKNGAYKRVTIHRMVAIHFLDNPNNLPQVNHEDGNKHNNVIDNLKWCTAEYNINHAFDNGLNVSNKNNPSMCRAIVQVGIDGQKINDYPSLMEAHRQTGFKHSNIHYAIKNKIIRYGYYWKYKEAI